MSASALYVGQVTHRRLRSPPHDLRYRVYMLLLDLETGFDAPPWPLAKGRFGLMSIRQADHGDGTATPLIDQVHARLVAAGLPDDGPVRLLCMPRVLGYGFNPLSVYFCHAAGGDLVAILYEVTNTFGERHSYLIPCGPEGGRVRQTVAKRFHVSPFMDMGLTYDFTIRPPGEQVQVSIGVSDGDGPLLAAAFVGARRPLTTAELVKAWLGHPLLTLKVIAGIHWEAVKLLAKGARYRAKPKPPAEAVTLGAAGTGGAPARREQQPRSRAHA